MAYQEAASLFAFGQLDFGVARLDHPPEAVTPRHFRVPEYLMHAADVRPQRRMRVGRVLENRLDTDEFAHVGAVVLDADRFAARPVHHDRWRCGDLHGLDAELDVVVFVDRVVVVWFVRIETNWLVGQYLLQSISGRSALGSVGGADPDDREWDLVLLSDPGAHRLGSDLGEAVVRAKRNAGRICLAERALPLIAVDRTGGAEDEALGGAAVVEQVAGFLRVGIHALGPLARADVDRSVEDVREIRGKIREVA